MIKIGVLGAGLVGSAIALDLIKDFEITVIDLDLSRLEKLSSQGIDKCLHADMTEYGSLRKTCSAFDLIINAAPGKIGFQVLEQAILSGKNIIDIAFYDNDPFKMDALAKDKNVCVICDMGVAPGMSNLLSASIVKELDETKSLEIYVGGLPKIRTLPFEYKAGFSPSDVIEEYMRPARYIKNGEIVIMPALSEPELIDFEGIGTLEAFNSDGLRSMLKTFHVPNMIEKTLRYKGHIEKIAFLKSCGFFSKKAIDINGQQILPMDLTTRLLFPMWEMQPTDEDITVMKIIGEGKKQGKPTKITYVLNDKYDIESKIHSMARTTGYAATAAARMVLEGHYNKPGIHPPEYIGKEDKSTQFMLKELRKRNVIFNKAISTLN